MSAAINYFHLFLIFPLLMYISILGGVLGRSVPRAAMLVLLVITLLGVISHTAKAISRSYIK